MQSHCRRTLDTWGVYLHEVTLGLINTSHVAEGDASVGLHLEPGTGLAKTHRVAWATPTHAPLRATGQQEEASHQQQGERQVACNRTMGRSVCS
jgi:hypothetical protein